MQQPQRAFDFQPVVHEAWSSKELIKEFRRLLREHHGLRLLCLQNDGLLLELVRRKARKEIAILVENEPYYVLSQKIHLYLLDELASTRGKTQKTIQYLEACEFTRKSRELVVASIIEKS